MLIQNEYLRLIGLGQFPLKPFLEDICLFYLEAELQTGETQRNRPSIPWVTS